MDLRSLREELDSPRATIQRNISLLEDRNWVEDTSEGYTATSTGCLLAIEFTELLEIVGQIKRLSPFLEAVNSLHHLRIEKFDPCEITVSEPHKPYQPMNRLLEISHTNTYTRGFSPVVPSIFSQYFQQTDKPGQNNPEIIFSRNIVDKPPNQSQYHDIYSNTNACIEILICETELPYGLLMFEETVLFIGYGVEGRIQALVELNSDESMEWCREIYEEYRQQSTQLDNIDSDDNVA